MGLVYELIMWPAAIAFSLYLVRTLTRPSTKAVFALGAERARLD